MGGGNILNLKRKEWFFFFFLEEARPVKPCGDAGRLIERRSGPLIRHLQENEVGELLDVVPVADAIVTEDITVVPDLLYYRG